jgi:hypothetical protein
VRTPYAATRILYSVANNNKNRGTAGAAPAPITRQQRLLLYVGGSVLGIGIIAIIVLLIGEATIKSSSFQTSAFWSTVALLPALAIPLGFLIFIALIVLTFVQRSRLAKDDGK